VAALAAITLSLNAGETLLSPRAKDTQISTAPASPGGANLATENRNFTGSPRALDHQNNVVKGVVDAPNLTARKCAVIGSPRQSENSTLSCCKVAKASCTASMACCTQK